MAFKYQETATRYEPSVSGSNQEDDWKFIKNWINQKINQKKILFQFFFFSKFWPQGERNEQPKEKVKNW